MPREIPADSLLPLSALSFAILLALADGRRHGYGIMKEIDLADSGMASPGAGSLYAALDRLLKQDLIEECPPPAAERDPRRRYYSLTLFGREVARAEGRRLAHLVESARRKKLIAPDPTPA